MICVHCDQENACECSDDVEAFDESYFLYVLLPNALREYKEAHGEYPIRAWNRNFDKNDAAA